MIEAEPKLAPLVLGTMASQALLVALSPTLVAIGRDLGASVATVGQARSAAASVAVVASLVIAGRVDVLGVRRLLAAGAALALIACAAVGLAPTLGLFLIAHVLVGLAFACLLTAGFAGVAAFPAERRPWAMGYVVGANALAWIVVNPIVATVTAWASWRAAQVVPGGIALAALLAAPAARPAQNRGDAPRRSMLLTERSARRWLGAELLAYGAWTALLTFIGAFFIERHGMREATVGWFLAAGAVAHLAASTRSAWLSHVVPRRGLIAGSALIMAVLLFALLSLPASPALAVATFCLAGLSAGIRTPASSALGLEQLPSHPGTMMGARTAVTQLGYLLGAVIGGAVISWGGYGMLGIVLAVGMAGSASLILRVDERPQGEPSDAYPLSDAGDLLGEDALSSGRSGSARGGPELGEQQPRTSGISGCGSDERLAARRPRTGFRIRSENRRRRPLRSTPANGGGLRKSRGRSTGSKPRYTPSGSVACAPSSSGRVRLDVGGTGSYNSDG